MMWREKEVLRSALYCIPLQIISINDREDLYIALCIVLYCRLVAPAAVEWYLCQLLREHLLVGVRPRIFFRSFSSHLLRELLGRANGTIAHHQIGMRWPPIYVSYTTSSCDLRTAESARLSILVFELAYVQFWRLMYWQHQQWTNSNSFQSLQL